MLEPPMNTDERRANKKLKKFGVVWLYPSKVTLKLSACIRISRRLNKVFKDAGTAGEHR